MTPGNLILLLAIFMLHLSTFFVASFLFRRTEAPLRATVLTSATVLVALMGWRWNRWGGALLLPTLAHLFFWTSLILVSQSLFPVVDWERRRGAVNTLTSFVFGYHRPSFVVENGNADKRISGRTLSRFGAGVIRVGVAQAAVLETTTQFSRVIGPGVSYVGRMESVKTVVDLHSQSRSAKVKALTKDGVPVEVEVFCLFRIASRGTSRATRDDFPFPGEAIRRVFYRQDGVDEDDEGYSWDDYAADRRRGSLACFRI